MQTACGDAHGHDLCFTKVLEAWKEEVRYVERHKMYDPINREWARKNSGQPPMTTTWVDMDKTVNEAGVKVRSSWAARNFKIKRETDREDLCRATAPLELKRFLLPRTATRTERGTRNLLIIDVRNAHLDPKWQKEVFAELPPEAGHGEDTMGKINFWLYAF